MNYSKKIILIFILCICFIPNISFSQFSEEIDQAKTSRYERVDYSERVFINEDSCNFTITQFNKDAIFFKTKFKCEADFYSSEFNSYANFRFAHFYKDANFVYVNFNNNVDFFGVVFDDLVNFQNAIFDTSNSFYRATFNKNANFSEAIFNENTNFLEAIFIKNVDFYQTNFNKTADFSGVKFNEKADFSAAKFNETLLFYYTVLPDTLNFSFIKYINKEIDLTPSKKNSLCHINLYGSDISKIKIDYSKFILYFDEKDSLSVDQKTSTYNTLLDKFKKDGLNDSYRNLDIEFREFKAKNGKWIDKLTNKINYIWWEYGYSKWWIFLWIIGTLILCTTITFFHLDYLMEKIYTNEFVKKFRHKDKTVFTKILCSFYYSLALFGGLKFDYNNVKQIRSWWTIYILLVYFFGLVCVGYLFNFIISK